MLVTRKVIVAYFFIANVLAFIIFLLGLFALGPSIDTIDVFVDCLPILSLVIFTNLGALVFSIITLTFHELAHIYTVKNLGYEPVLVHRPPAIHILSRNIESISDIRQISLAGPFVDILVLLIIGVVIIIYPTNNPLIGVLLLSVLSRSINDFLSSNLPMEGNDCSIALQINREPNQNSRKLTSSMSLLQLIYIMTILMQFQWFGTVFLVGVALTGLRQMHHIRSKIVFKIIRGLKNDLRAISIN